MIQTIYRCQFFFINPSGILHIIYANFVTYKFIKSAIYLQVYVNAFRLNNNFARYYYTISIEMIRRMMDEIAFAFERFFIGF